MKKFNAGTVAQKTAMTAEALPRTGKFNRIRFEFLL
jgi:hypothetical protein